MIKEGFARFKKNLSMTDIAMIKFAVFFFTLWIVTLLSQPAFDFVKRNNFIWFVLFILFSIKPLNKFFRK